MIALRDLCPQLKDVSYQTELMVPVVIFINFCYQSTKGNIRPPAYCQDVLVPLWTHDPGFALAGSYVSQAVTFLS